MTPGGDPKYLLLFMSAPESNTESLLTHSFRNIHSLIDSYTPSFNDSIAS